MTTNVYMGLNGEEIAPLGPSAQQIADLGAIGFTVHEGDVTWSAVREVEGYRTALTLTRNWSMASTIRVTDAKVIALKVCTSLHDAVDSAMDLALDVDLATAFCALIRSELGSAA